MAVSYSIRYVCTYVECDVVCISVRPTDILKCMYRLLCAGDRSQSDDDGGGASGGPSYRSLWKFAQPGQAPCIDRTDIRYWYYHY